MIYFALHIHYLRGKKKFIISRADMSWVKLINVKEEWFV